jgi:hypothetical protein
MPIRSKAQERLMYAALKDPKGTGIPRSVAEKFVGPNAHKESEMKKPLPAFMMKKDEKKKPAKKMSSGGFTRAADGVATHGRTKATQVKMMGGGKC